MERDKEIPEKSKQETGAPSVSPADRKPWEEPKLAFIEPKLTKHGDLEKITGKQNGFFGQFSP